MTLSTHKVLDDYNRIASLFSLGSAILFPQRDRLMKQIVLPALGSLRGKTVLDLGCGPGMNFPYLQEEIGPQGTLIGIDFSEKLVTQARQRVELNQWKNTTLIQGDASNLPQLISQPVDLVFCSLALCLIPDKLSILNAAKDILKSDGRLAVIEIKPFSRGGWLLNPLLYLSLLPIPSNKIAVFQESLRLRELIPQVFANFHYTEYYLGSVYVAIGSN